MAQLEVDPAVLYDIAEALRRCVDVAREFADRRGRLTELVADCGDPRLRSTAEHFVGRWGYGLGLLVGDAEHLAGQLEHSADQYRHLEAEITRAVE